MSRNDKLPALLLTALFFAAAGLVPVESSLFKLLPFPAVTLRAAEYSAQDPGDDEAMPFPAPRSKSKTARKKSRASDKGASKKADTAAKKKDAETSANAGDTTELKFSQDIAPILAKNCSGCHSGDRPGLKKGKLELTSFEKLLKGTTTNKPVVVPGNPEESSLVLRIKGEETPRMPQGNNVLSDEAISKIERWVKAGASSIRELMPRRPWTHTRPAPSRCSAESSPSCHPKSAIKKSRRLGWSVGSKPVPK